LAVDADYELFCRAASTRIVLVTTFDRLPGPACEVSVFLRYKASKGTIEARVPVLEVGKESGVEKFNPFLNEELHAALLPRLF
jgi:hypothetical protein